MLILTWVGIIFVKILCNISQDAIFLTCSEILCIFLCISYLGRLLKILTNIAFFILQRNLHEIFDTIFKK
jgi:hypothetical protein